MVRKQAIVIALHFDTERCREILGGEGRVRQKMDGVVKVWGGVIWRGMGKDGWRQSGKGKGSVLEKEGGGWWWSVSEV